jgi:predicted RNase H-like nuclease (RuvC/YqgF family)
VSEFVIKSEFVDELIELFQNEFTFDVLKDDSTISNVFNRLKNLKESEERFATELQGYATELQPQAESDWASRKSTSDLKSKISYLEDNIDKMRVEKNNLKAHLRHVSKLNYESHVELERFKKEECEVTNALKVISKIMLGKGD